LQHQIRDLIMFLLHHGTLAVFGLVALEEAGLPFPIPGDVWLMYVGVRIARGQIAWWLAALAGTLAVATGSTILYTIIRSFGPQLLHTIERRPWLRTILHINPETLIRAERWLRRYGFAAVLFGRLIPGLRIAMTVVSATFSVPYRAFIGGTLISAFIWVNAFFLAGRLVGRITRANIAAFVAHFTLARLAILVLILVIVVLVLIRFRPPPLPQSRPGR
jgi:membrane protein DedA with SNARE-associated domain